MDEVGEVGEVGDIAELDELLTYIDRHKVRCMRVLFNETSEESESGYLNRIPAAKGQTWPASTDGPLACVLHIKVAELPSIPKRIAAYEYVSVFMDTDYVEYGSQSKEGGDFCIRCLEPGSATQIIEHPQASQMRPKKCRFVIADDYPDSSDILELLESDQIDCDPDLVYEATEVRCNIGGVKINGYPAAIQGPTGGAYTDDEFGLIIDLNDDIRLRFGDSAVFQVGWSAHHQNWLATWDSC